MKRKIILSLSVLLLLFSAGTAGTLIYITNTTATLNRLISLHQVEMLREGLVINLQAAQTDLFTVYTPFGKHLNFIVENVQKLNRAAEGCSSCHHRPEIAERIGEIQHLITDYENALSYYITASADIKMIEKIKMDAAEVGNRILGLTQEMTFTATKRLQEETSTALAKIANARVILFTTIIIAVILALLISLQLTKAIAHPINELVNSARMIASGNLGYKTSYQGSNEFGELAQSFNAMSVALKEGYENIQQQQERLAESERKFRTLSEFAYDWEYWLDENGVIVFMSPSCERITGYTQEEFVSDPNLLRNIVHPEDRKTWENHSAAYSEPQHDDIEFRLITKEGTEKWLSHICGPIYVGGTFLGRRVSNRDITDRKRLEEQLMQSQKMESLGLMAGGVAHDFNNLMTAIIGYSSMIQDELSKSGNGTLTRYIGQVMSACDKAQALTSSLLAFSHKQIIKPHPIRVSDVIRNISVLVKKIIGEDIDLYTAYADRELAVLADPHQIEQVLMNLITNAKDAMPAGGRLSIETTPVELNTETTKKYGAKSGSYMAIQVSDTGVGIDSKDLVHIFEPFFTTKEKGRGTGLGLAMVYGIVKQHGGFVDVYSEKDWGTTFKIYLPALDIPIDESIKRKEPKGFDADLSGHETIMVAEDDAAVREFVKDAFEKYGYHIVLAVDGADAIEKYTANKDAIDAIVLDVVMPKKNGKEVYNFIREIDPHIKAIFMSGYTQDILTSKGIYEEGLEFISKPLEISTLMLKVRELLNNKGGPAS